MQRTHEQVQKRVDELEQMLAKVEAAIRDFYAHVEVDESGWGANTWVLDAPTRKEARRLRREHLRWHEQAKPLIRTYLPDRFQEFKQREKTISSHLALQIDGVEKPREAREGVMDVMSQQIVLVTAVPGRVRSERLVNPRRISAEVVGEELQQAQELLEEGMTRCAGVLAGVAIERHLILTCESATSEVDYHQSTNINQAAQALYEAGEITESDHKQTQYLSSLRAKCAHMEEEDPSQREVERLVKQTGDFIQQYT